MTRTWSTCLSVYAMGSAWAGHMCCFKCLTRPTEPLFDWTQHSKKGSTHFCGKLIEYVNMEEYLFLKKKTSAENNGLGTA
mmetsp:Transcript_294/g.377  ORF Transcript_294/g.377 Transcript_294/m.377 type:complete len:80 (-) Transcript_294:69-308(-)